MTEIGIGDTPVDRQRLRSLIEACIGAVKLLLHDVLTDGSIPVDFKVDFVRAWDALENERAQMLESIANPDIASDAAFVAHGLSGDNLAMKVSALSLALDEASAARRRHEREQKAREDAARKTGALFGIVNAILGSFAQASGTGGALKEFKDVGEALLKGVRKLF